MPKRTILFIDSSARLESSSDVAHGSHSRRLSTRFRQRWLSLRPDDEVRARDVAREPPPFVSGSWIHAAFTPPAQREAWMHAELALSDALVDEMIAADLIVIGVPMYNFNVPASLKAYIDQVVRVGRTFGFDRTRPGKPYWPLLSEQQKRLVILSSRGDHGYGYGEENFSLNHTEPSIQAAFAYMGVQESYRVAVDYDEFGGTLLGDSLARAEAQVDELVQALAADRA